MLKLDRARKKVTLSRPRSRDEAMILGMMQYCLRLVK